MEEYFLLESVKRITASHYDLLASLYTTLENKSDNTTETFELQLHDVDEPLRLVMKLGAASQVLVQHNDVWEDYDYYLDQLETAQHVRWNDPTAASTYLSTIQMLNARRAAREDMEEQEQKILEAREARKALEEKVSAITATFSVFDSRFPPEVRDRIWDYVMETPDVLRPYRYRSDLGSHCAGYWDASESPKNVNITRVSQRVRDEAAYRLYRNTTFAFPEPQTLECFLDNTSSKILATIRKVELSFDHSDFFRMFGAWELVHEGHRQWREFAPVLSKLKQLNLHKLTIRMPHRGLLWRYGWGNGCYFVVCKWILKATKDAVACHSNVHLAFEVDGLSEMQRLELAVILSAGETLSYEALSDGTLTLSVPSQYVLACRYMLMPCRPPVCECHEPCGEMPAE